MINSISPYHPTDDACMYACKCYHLLSIFSLCLYLVLSLCFAVMNV